MKKIALFLGFAAIALLTACTQAPTPTAEETATPPVTETTTGTSATVDATTMSGVMMSNGKMVILMKDGANKDMTSDMTMADGTVVTVDGKVMKDGKEVETLQNDSWVMASGAY